MTITLETLNDRQTANFNAIKFVNHKTLAIESELILLKHANYAFRGVGDLTQQFLDEYIEAYKHYAAIYIDIETSFLKQGVKHTSLFENPTKTINSLWRARQYADAIGISYRKFVWRAFGHLMDRDYKNLPAPNQLYSDHVIDFMDNYFNDEDHGFGLKQTHDPRFLLKNYSGEPVQDEYIRRQIEHLDTLHPCILLMKLANYCYGYKTLDQSVITEVFGMRICDVRRKIMKVSSFDSKIDVTDFRRSCFGLPFNEKSDVNASCHQCPLREECLIERQSINNLALEELGTTDPRGDEKRLKAAERKRKQREREKSERLMV